MAPCWRCSLLAQSMDVPHLLALLRVRAQHLRVALAAVAAVAVADAAQASQREAFSVAHINSHRLMNGWIMLFTSLQG